ncbi:MAG: 50S ribosomal protein L29 [Desulfovibrionales bacterium]
MNVQDIRKLSDQDLQEKLQDYNEELFNLRFQHATAQLENTQRIPQVKTNIARIKTVVREREMEKSHE